MSGAHIGPPSGAVAPTRNRIGRRGRAIVLVLGIVALWVALGFGRATTIARSYFDSTHDGANAVNVEARLQPAVPPFWGVEIHGNIIEAGASGPGYISAMILWVEPISGWVLVMGQG